MSDTEPRPDPRLTEYQVRFFLDFVRGFAAGRRHHLAAPVGAGKSFVVANVTSELVRTGHANRVLILTPAPALAEQWVYMLGQFAGGAALVTGEKLRLLVEELKADGSGWPEGVFVLSTTTAHRAEARVLLGTVPWDLVVVDEARGAKAEVALTNALAGAPSRPVMLILLNPGADSQRVGPADQVHDLSAAVAAYMSARGQRFSDLVVRETVEYERTREEQELVCQVGAVARVVRPEMGRALLRHAASSIAALEACAARWSAATETSPSEKEALEGLLRAIDAVGTDSWLAEMVTLFRPASVDADRQDVGPLFLREPVPPSFRGVQVSESRHAVVFTECCDTGDYVASALESVGIGVLTMREGMTAEARGALVATFRERADLVLVVAAAATDGVNLAFAQLVLHFDLPMSVAGFAQREGRYSRFGREKPCRVVLLRDRSGCFAVEEMLLRVVAKYDISGVGVDAGELDLDALLSRPAQ